MSCNVCIEKYNKSNRIEVRCDYCEFSACKECQKKYILSNESDAHCMGCKKGWDRKVIVSKFDRAFVDKQYKVHREMVLYDREKAMMPATQPHVEREIECERIDEEVRGLNADVARLQQNIQERMNERNVLTSTTTTERKQFVRKCPYENCKGFLSTQWKCTLCDNFTCSECNEVKGKNNEHICDKNNVETVKMLARDTKCCPGCGTGIFKILGCFAKNVPILLYNGETKMSQDIVVGDTLVGDDGMSRKVLDVFSGEDDLYEVNQNNGMSYIVNSKHTLVLKCSSDKHVGWYESIQAWKVFWFDRCEKRRRTKTFTVNNEMDKNVAREAADRFVETLNFPDEIEMTVDEYLKLDKWSKSVLLGYKCDESVKWEKKEVPLHPYILGLWLGDGTHSVPVIATKDNEIKQAVAEWCVENDAEVVDDGNYKLRIRRKGYKFTRNAIESKDATVPFPEFSKRTNPFTNKLKECGVFKNKHIPSLYLQNDRSTRLELLAGIIDSDGHVSKEQEGKRVVITQVAEKLSRQIILLAQSLGFVVNVTVIEKKGIKCPGVERKDYNNQYYINISGEALGDIPTRVLRKKCKGSVANKDYQRTAIKVTSVGRGMYYGWSIDGNRRFLLEDFTVARNCSQMFCVECNTAFDWKTLRIETGAIHNPHYFEYLNRTGNAERTIGEVRCGREIDNYYVSQVSRTMSGDVNGQKEVGKVLHVLRQILHIRFVELRRFTVNRVENNLDLRVAYMRNKLEEDEFRRKLQKREKETEKKREVGDILNMFINCMTEIVYRNMEGIAKRRFEVRGMFNEMKQLRMYTNECFGEIANVYKCKKYRIDNDFALV